MKIKKININYINKGKGYREVINYEKLPFEKQELFNIFFKTYLDEIPIEELTIEIPKIIHKKKAKVKYDVICPLYWINEYFVDNVKKWFQEIPINYLYFGINNKNLTINCDEPRIKFIDQTKFKTLGKCLSDLMCSTNTDWFVYFHTDVDPVEGSFNGLVSKIDDDIGIIESDRLHWTGKTYEEKKFFEPYQNYYSTPRSYSGFQLINKNAILPLLTKIDDDFIYRNEDLIFQHECQKNGFKYIKTLSLHIHQCLSQKWTFSEKETNIIQIKGLIKYTNPTPIVKNSMIFALKDCKKKNYMTTQEILSFCYKHNPNWGEVVLEVFE